MNQENQAVATELLNQIAASPKTNLILGGGIASVYSGFTLNGVAVVCGILLALVSTYNQVMLGIRNKKEEKKREMREAYEFKKANPDAPDDLL